MSDLRETIYFWLAFGILVPVILSKFYLNKGEKQKNQLRFASLMFQLIALILLFFVWIEVEGIFFSWGLAAYGAALILSMALVISRRPRSNILGAKIAIANSIWLFIIMLLLFPETNRLTTADIAPIISVLLMLSNNVVVLLLWHQLQLLVSKKSTGKKKEVKWLVMSLGRG